jgi:hypothetical protein
MDDIANAIGMKKASLYYYYKNKDNIISDTMETVLHSFLKMAKEKISKLKIASKKLYLLVNLETKYFQEKVGTFDLNVSTIIEAQPVMNEMMEKFRTVNVDMWAGIIQEGIDNGEFRKCNAQKVADTIRTILDSIKFRECQVTNMFSVNQIDYDKIKDSSTETIELIINGLKKC